MKYEVNEKKHYKIENINKLDEFKYEFKHLETTFDLEKYVLEVEFCYIDSVMKKEIKIINLPVELATTMTEQLTATVKKVDLLMKNQGVELDLTLDIEVEEIETNEEVKEEIKEIYQQELEDKMSTRDTKIIEEELTVEEEKSIIKTEISEMKFDINSNLKTDYAMYKILSLDEASLDKISVKYNLPMDYLYEAKKNKNKVIVYVKE